MTTTNLAKTSPETAIKGLLAVAYASTELAEIQPAMATALQEVILESVIQMVEETPEIAAVAVVSVSKISPEIGAAAEEEAVAAGLQRDYLTAASPIMP